MSRSLVSTGHGWNLTIICLAFVSAVVVSLVGRLPLITGLSVGAVIIVACVAMLLSGLQRKYSFLCIAMGLAVVVGLLRGGAVVYPTGPTTVDGHLGKHAVVIVGTVRDGNASQRGSIVVDAESLVTGDSEQAVHGGVLVSTATQLVPPHAGDRVQISAQGLQGLSNRPGGMPPDALEREDIEAIATAPSISVTHAGGFSVSVVIDSVRAWLVRGVDGVVPEPLSTLLLGIAFGIRRTLSHDVASQLQDAGLIHIVVVSGLKVAIVASLVQGIGRVRSWSWRATVATTVAVVALYVVVSGAGPAAIRSAIMGLVALSIRRTGRRADAIPLLSLTAAVMLAANPQLCTDVGFQLSFVGTLGILLCADAIGHHIPGPRILKDPFAVTIAAQLATFPIMANTFGVISLVGPLANMLVLPLLPLMIVLGAVGAAIAALSPVIGWIPLQVAALCAHFVTIIASATSAFSFAAIHVQKWPLEWTIVAVAVAACVGSAWGVWRTDIFQKATVDNAPSRHRLLVSAAMGVAIASGAALWCVVGSTDTTFRITALSLGSSVATIVHTPTGETALIDGGADPQLLGPALGRTLGPMTTTLGTIILTSGEHKAVAGVDAVRGQYTVGAVIAPSAALQSGVLAITEQLRQQGTRIMATTGDQEWQWGGLLWRLCVVESQTAGRPVGAVLIDDGRQRVLVVGVLSADDTGELLAQHSDIRADVLVSETSTGVESEATLAVVHPSVVIVPRATTKARLPPSSHLLATGYDGDVTYVATERGFERA